MVLKSLTKMLSFLMKVSVHLPIACHRKTLTVRAGGYPMAPRLEVWLLAVGTCGLGRSDSGCAGAFLFVFFPLAPRVTASLPSILRATSKGPE